MRRRKVLQALLFGPLAALLAPQRAHAQPPPTGTVYSDSDNNSPATLAALYDGERQTGGVVYRP
jgi:hypothetical protein